MEQLNFLNLIDTPKPTSPYFIKIQQVQEKYPDTIPLIRIGDFYEAIGDKAAYVAELLDLTLTGRFVGNGIRASMCGFPYHMADRYINKILKLHSVVVIENEQEYFIKSQEEARKE